MITIQNKSYEIIAQGKPIKKKQKFWLDDGDGKNPDTQTVVEVVENDFVILLREQTKKKRGRPRKKK